MLVKKIVLSAFIISMFLVFVGLITIGADAISTLESITGFILVVFPTIYIGVLSCYFASREI